MRTVVTCLLSHASRPQVAGNNVIFNTVKIRPKKSEADVKKKDKNRDMLLDLLSGIVSYCSPSLF